MTYTLNLSKSRVSLMHEIIIQEVKLNPRRRANVPSDLNIPKEMAPRSKIRVEGNEGEMQSEEAFAQLAQKHWLKTSKKAAAKVKVKPDVLKKEVWDVLEKENFPFRLLSMLENLQLLERYESLPRFQYVLTRIQLPMARVYGGLVQFPRPAHCADVNCEDEGASANLG